MKCAAVLAFLIAAAGLAAAADVPVGGRTLSIGARKPAKRSLAFRSAVESTIAAPFPDPTAGAALVVFAGTGPGQCHAVIPLPAPFWSAVGGAALTRGWRYRDPAATQQGVKAVTIAPRGAGGRIVVKARGEFPCGLETPQSGPVNIELRVGGTRYCAAFGGTVRTNEPGRFRANGATAPAACRDTDVTVADLNVLHGLFCPGPTAGCRRAERAALVRQFVIARGCPDVISLQEIINLGPTLENAELFKSELTNACATPYAVAYHGDNPFDGEMIFSRYPIVVDELLDLYGPLRHALHVRVDHPIGLVDVYATHLASGSDLAGDPCGTPAFSEPCPADCVVAGAPTVRDCQAVQVAKHVEATHTGPSPALLVGDFNETPGSFVYAQFAGRGWTDAYLAAGNPECVPATGVGCTSGREDEALTDLESPALGQDERIDFIWVVPPGPGTVCTGSVEAAGDPDADGTATRLFADEPNPFAPSCGPSPDAVCWASDHTGVQADVNCF